MSDNEWICSICLDSDTSGCHVLSPCNHKFHTSCIIESLRRNGPKCPLCRGLPAPNGNTSSNNINENYVNNYHVDWNYDPNDVQDIAGNFVYR
jgi:hypothetical protein